MQKGAAFFLEDFPQFYFAPLSFLASFFLLDFFEFYRNGRWGEFFQRDLPQFSEEVVYLSYLKDVSHKIFSRTFFRGGCFMSSWFLRPKSCFQNELYTWPPAKKHFIACLSAPSLS